MGVALLLLGSLALAEPSVYGGSYGAGSGQVTKNKKMIYALRQKVSRLQEEIDGLRSVVEGLSQQINQLSRRKSGSPSVTPEQLSRLERRIAALEKRPAVSSSKPVKAQRKAPQKARVQTKGKSPQPASGTPSKSSGDAYLQKAPSNKLFSRGVRLINQKRYAEAKKRFNILKGRNYKPASTQFYLGEIAYRTGRYDDAVLHYQKSAELNENAAYMDRLLLHTGIALEKSGDKEQARNFFQAIVDGYPGTSSAAVAKKHLK
jgi:TolA-binding protein